MPPATQVKVDQIARDGVHEALARIDRHEAVCQEIQEHNKNALGRIEVVLATLDRKIGAVDKKLFYAAVGTISVLIGVTGALLTIVLHL